MKHNFKYALTIVACLLLFSAKAQYYYYNDNYYDKDIIWEIGGSVGAMNGITDVGSKKGSKLFPLSQVDFKSTGFNLSFYVSAIYQNIVGLRLEATWGSVAGADSNGAQPKRNLSFRSPVNEIAGMIEFHPLMLWYNDEAPVFSPYIALGLGYFSFNPQAKLNGSWINLQPLRTEGQGFPETAGYMDMDGPYKTKALAGIFGGGIKYELSPLVTIRAEVLYRYTNTDYLDDVHGVYIDPVWFDNNLSPINAALAKQLYDRSVEKPSDFPSHNKAPRGNPETNDSYFTFNLKLGISLGRERIR